MQDTSNALNVLSAMITPAVLISACGTLIVSTSMRLARIVDRVRELSHTIEKLASDETIDFPEERRCEVERQLSTHTRRGKLIMRALTSYYVALGLFVAATISVAMVAVFHRAAWSPSAIGIAGTLFLFYGSVLLIAETRLALRSVNSEMEFTLRLRGMYQARRRAEAGEPMEPPAAPPSTLKRITSRLRLG